LDVILTIQYVTSDWEWKPFHGWISKRDSICFKSNKERWICFHWFEIETIGNNKYKEEIMN